MPSLDRPRAVAEAARERRAALLEALASGELPVSRVGDDRRAAEVKALAIAEAVPGVGKVRARRALDAVGVVPSTLWGDLSPAQESALVDALTDGGAPPAGGP